LLVTKEQLIEIEKLYKGALPLPNPDIHEVIGEQINLAPSKVFFGINLVREKMRLPKLEYPKRRLAVTPEQLMAIETLYEPYLPLPPLGIHKIICKQLRMDEWRVHVAIGLIRKNRNMNRWNEDRDDLPPEMKAAQQKSREEREKAEQEKAAAKALAAKEAALAKAVDAQPVVADKPEEALVEAPLTTDSESVAEKEMEPQQKEESAESASVEAAPAIKSKITRAKKVVDEGVLELPTGEEDVALPVVKSKARTSKATKEK
jgi:hypothetical protein